MDTSTGEIYTEEEMKQLIANKPEKAKFMKMIPKGQEDMMMGMNRAGRRAYYKKHKTQW